MPRRPFDATRADADVAGKNHHFRVGLGRNEIRKLRVQVTQNVNFHYT